MPSPNTDFAFPIHHSWEWSLTLQHLPAGFLCFNDKNASFETQGSIRKTQNVMKSILFCISDR